MIQSREAIKSGGGSIRVGTTGTIASLMTRELDSMKPAPSSSSSCASSSINYKPQRSTARKSCDIEPSGDEDLTRKMKGHVKSRNRHRVPMLSSDNTSFYGTPSRDKPERRGPIVNLVEVVDIKCGNLESGNRAWTVPISSRLRKLGFSKLSNTVV